MAKGCGSPEQSLGLHGSCLLLSRGTLRQLMGGVSGLSRSTLSTSSKMVYCALAR